MIWKTHGFAYSIVAISILLTCDTPSADSSEAATWQFLQIGFLTCLGLQLLVWSEVDKKTKSSSFWIIACVSLVALMAMFWIEAELSRQHLLAQPNEGWGIANQRIRISAFVMSILGGLLIVWFGARRHASAWIWGIACLIAPAAGFALAHLYVPANLESVIEGGRWDRLLIDFSNWFSQPDRGSALAGWCWLTPSVLLPLMAVGLWRTLGRGFRQRGKGQLPIAWLLLLAALLLLIALLPASSDRVRPFGLFWLGIVLSVFAVADLALLVYERLSLEAPAQGPSDVPHV
jgi:hypothetical protein